MTNTGSTPMAGSFENLLSDWDQDDCEFQSDNVAKYRIPKRVIHARIGHFGGRSHWKHCLWCAMTKSVLKSPSRYSAHRATRFLERVHWDTVGPISSVGYDGQRYIIQGTDDYSGKVWGAALNQKTMKNSASIYESIRIQDGEYPECCRSDQGDEFGEGFGTKSRKEESVAYG